MTNNDPRVPARPPPTPTPPSGGREILREVERLRREPIRFRCLGMSAGMLVLVVLLCLALWYLLR